MTLRRRLGRDCACTAEFICPAHVERASKDVQPASRFGRQRDRWTVGGPVRQVGDELTPDEFLHGEKGGTHGTTTD